MVEDFREEATLAVIRVEDIRVEDIRVAAVIPAGECPVEAVIPEVGQEAGAAVAAIQGQEVRARAPASRLRQPILLLASRRAQPESRSNENGPGTALRNPWCRISLLTEPKAVTRTTPAAGS